MKNSKPNSKIKTEGLLNKLIVGIVITALISFLLTFFYLPIVKILNFALIQEGSFTFDIFWSTLTSSLNLNAIAFTFIQSLLTTFICMFLGFPVSFFLAKYSFKGRKLIINLLTVPFVLPSIVVLLGFIILYGEGGFINQIWINIAGVPLINLYGSIEGIVLAHSFYNISVIIRMMIPAWENLDPNLTEISKTLGGKNWMIFWKIMFPQIKNYLISAGLLVFTYTFNSFALVLYLGEVKFQTLEVRIFKLMRNTLDFPAGASLGILQLFFNLIIIILYIIFEKKTRAMASGKDNIYHHEKIVFLKSNWKKTLGEIILIIFTILIILFSISPMIAVFITSLTPNTLGGSPFWGYTSLLSNDYDTLLGAPPSRLLLNTLTFAFLTTLITLIFSIGIVFILRNRLQRVNNYKKSVIENIISLAIILPMGTSSITLAMGLFLQLKDSAVFKNYVWILIVLAHVLISVPFATRSILSAYNRIDTDLLNIASTLGASRLRIFWKVELPMIKSGLIVAGIFSFAISLGEFGATNFLARAEYGTLSLGISKLLSSRTMQLPASMASILIIVTFICFFLIQKTGEKDLKF
ncbi:ABC transporter permease [Promethearchaeum syntrophicum]|uniref:ABC transporter permease n=1 Tax=Promethearchaeum syntrophicum TaxID=2594042 RepID=A0A5B9DFD8_9ARCH|nr:iron ABC transporter permease [Candidatus Prometheoarchaeum syntrophicum]QEE18039.1 Molybdate/tungstate transport system permease protein WtpB [Candidatus Prometheoarchaeum syntrophicum]